MGKGENAGYQHFHHFPRFKTLFFSRRMKPGPSWKTVYIATGTIFVRSPKTSYCESCQFENSLTEKIDYFFPPIRLFSFLFCLFFFAFLSFSFPFFFYHTGLSSLYMFVPLDFNAIFQHYFCRGSVFSKFPTMFMPSLNLGLQAVKGKDIPINSSNPEIQCKQLTSNRLKIQLNLCRRPPVLRDHLLKRNCSDTTVLLKST